MTKKMPPTDLRKSPWLWLLFLLGWIALIIYLSDQPGLNTLPFLYRLKILPQIKDKNLANEMEYVVRKSAHIIAYAVLYLITFHTIQRFKTRPRTYYSFVTSTFVSLLFCFVFAISDEIHQYFVPTRSGRIFDVLIDMFGVFLGQLFFLFFLYRRKKRIKKRVS